VWKEFFKSTFLAILSLFMMGLVVSLWLSLRPTMTYQLWISGTADPLGNLEEIVIVPVNIKENILTSAVIQAM
jgi:hypothetical protein